MSELTEDQKLVKLGLRSPNQTQSAGGEVLEKFKNKISELFDKFQEKFEDANLGSFGEFETWLVDNGFDSTTAKNIRNKFEEKYSTFSDFKTKVIDDFESWGDFENAFASNTGLRSDRSNEDGLAAAGVKVYEESGVGRSGQSIPAGGVEIYGKEIHFSQTESVKKTKEESSGGKDPIVWDNLRVEPNGLQTGDTIKVEADVTNNTGFVGNIVAELIVDGVVQMKKTRELRGNTTITVSFKEVVGGIIPNATGTFDIGISKAGSESVTVAYGGL